MGDAAAAAEGIGDVVADGGQNGTVALMQSVALAQQCGGLGTGVDSALRPGGVAAHALDVELQRAVLGHGQGIVAVTADLFAQLRFQRSVGGDGDVHLTQYHVGAQAAAEAADGGEGGVGLGPHDELALFAQTAGEVAVGDDGNVGAGLMGHEGLNIVHARLLVGTGAGQQAALHRQTQITAHGQHIGGDDHAGLVVGAAAADEVAVLNEGVEGFGVDPAVAHRHHVGVAEETDGLLVFAVSGQSVAPVILGAGGEAQLFKELRRSFQRAAAFSAEGSTGQRLAADGGDAHQRHQFFQNFLTVCVDPSPDLSVISCVDHGDIHPFR